MANVIQLSRCTGRTFIREIVPNGAEPVRAGVRERTCAFVLPIFSAFAAVYNGVVSLFKGLVSIVTLNSLSYASHPTLRAYTLNEARLQALASLKSAVVALPVLLMAPVLPLVAFQYVYRRIERFSRDRTEEATEIIQTELPAATSSEDVHQSWRRVRPLIIGSPDEHRLRLDFGQRVLTRISSETALEAPERCARIAMLVMAEITYQPVNRAAEAVREEIAAHVEDLELGPCIDLQTRATARHRCTPCKILGMPQLSTEEPPDTLREWRDRIIVNRKYLSSKTYLEYGLAAGLSLGMKHSCIIDQWFTTSITGLLPDFWQTQEGIFLLKLALRERGKRRSQLLETSVLALSRGIINTASDVGTIVANFTPQGPVRTGFAVFANITSIITDFIGLYKNVVRDTVSYAQIRRRAAALATRIEADDLDWPEELQPLRQALLEVLHRQMRIGLHQSLTFSWVALSRFGLIIPSFDAIVQYLRYSGNDSCLPEWTKLLLFYGRLGWALGGMKRLAITGEMWLTQRRYRAMRENLLSDPFRKVMQGSSCEGLQGREFQVLSLAGERHALRGDPVSIAQVTSSYMREAADALANVAETLDIDPEQLQARLSEKIRF